MSSDPTEPTMGTNNGLSKRASVRKYFEARDKIKMPPVQCPICEGRGKLPHPSMGHKEARSHVALSVMAKGLREHGYSLREIGKLLGYNSPRSVQNLLKKHGMK